MSESDDYAPDDVDAARALLADLAKLFADLGDDLALVGGWVPALLLPDAGEVHVGSLDVDLLMRSPTNDIHDRLKAAGYRTDARQECRFWKDVDGIAVPVDILAPEFPPRARKKGPLWTEFRPFVAPGASLALDGARRVTVSKPGESLSVEIRVADVVPFIVMKAYAMAQRRPKKAKDAYDIYFVLKHYPSGHRAIAGELSLRRSNPQVVAGLKHLEGAFRSTEDTGPKDVAMFLADDEPAALKRDAYERVQALLSLLDEPQ